MGPECGAGFLRVCPGPHLHWSRRPSQFSVAGTLHVKWHRSCGCHCLRFSGLMALARYLCFRCCWAGTSVVSSLPHLSPQLQWQEQLCGWHGPHVAISVWWLRVHGGRVQCRAQVPAIQSLATTGLKDLIAKTSHMTSS
jgi:hypothetical protein